MRPASIGDWTVSVAAATSRESKERGLVMMAMTAVIPKVLKECGDKEIMRLEIFQEKLVVGKE